MGTPEILIEHSRENKVRKVMRLRPDRSVFVIGSSNEADLKIAGEGIGGCHAVLKYRAPHWYVSDISGTDSLKVDNQPVVEARIGENSIVEIGPHRLRLRPQEKVSNLFAEEENSGSPARQQVVVRVRGVVIDTRLIGIHEAFVWKDEQGRHELPPPKDGHWVVTEVGPRTIQQRLVRNQETVAAEKIEVDRDIRNAFGVGLILLSILSGLLFLASKKEAAKPEAALDKKSMEIIFNAKAIKQKRAESQKVVSQKAAKGGGSNKAAAPSNASAQPEQSMAPVANAKAAAALTSLRSSGLSALVGKIAKRANRSALMIGTAGISADKAGSGRAFYSTGTSIGTGGGAAVKEGPGFRLGGVGTKGKGGGVGAGGVREGTNLAGGGVGTGNVVALVDEESVVDGGLDRDAIAEVIKRNIGQIRYCYERQLSSNPDLYGKVMVRFTIDAGGEVAGPKIEATTLKSAMVEGCILRRLASWKFPLPRGGTQVNVTYPFLFKALE
jgi:hypothetical protein